VTCRTGNLMTTIRQRYSFQGATFFLVVLLLGALACPCRGLSLLYHSSKGESADPPRSCCDACCHAKAGEGSSQSEQPPPHHSQDCACLSGCCAPYLLPESDPAIGMVIDFCAVDVPVVSLASLSFCPVSPVLLQHDGGPPETASLSLSSLVALLI
jgi:hypothetical protein